MRFRVNKWRWCGVLALMAAWVWASASAGVLARDQVSPNSLVADQLVALARVSLGNGGEPRDDQVVRAQILLELASEVSPDDPSVWRLRMELARQLGDGDTELAALRRYCSLSPRDDAAQLELTSRLIGDYQTLPDRVDAIGRMLDGSAASMFSEALRSRLASMAAGYALEIGDSDTFVMRLKQAVSLDVTNAHAAALTYQWALSRGAPVEQIGSALMLMVRANPLDSQPRRALADLLASQGAYRDAAQQYEIAQRLATEPPTEAIIYRWVLSLAALGRSEDAIGLVREYEALLGARERAQSPATSDAATEGDAAVELPRVSVDLELLRLAVLQKQGQTARAEGSYGRLEAMMRAQLDEQADKGRAELLWLGLIFGDRAVDAAELDGLEEERPDRARWVACLRGWAALRNSQLAQAEEIFRPLAEENIPLALYGLAQATDVEGVIPRADLLRRVVAAAPGELLGMMAAWDLLDAGQDEPGTAPGAALAEAIEQWPDVLTSPDPIGAPWVQLSLEFDQARYRYLDPIAARLTLRNATSLPLSLGEGGSLPTRLFLYVSPRRAGESVGDMPPIVIDLRRRIRLGPLESLEVPTRIDRGDLGLLLKANPFESIHFGVTAVLDPRVGSGRGHATGLLGTRQSVKLVERPAVPATQAAIDLWLAVLAEPDPIEQFEAVARLSRLIAMIGSAPESVTGGAELIGRVSEALDGYYESLDDPVRRAWVVRYMPQEVRGEQACPGVHRAAERSDETLVRVLYLATQIGDGSSPIIDAALRAGDQRVVRFAEGFRNGYIIEKQQREAAEAAAAAREAEAAEQAGGPGR